MLVIGLTGGIGSGKSTVARMFAAVGVPVIDTDEISHALTAPNGAAISLLREAFGADIFKLDGALDRALLRSRVLADEHIRLKLEAILHPMIRDVVECRLAEIQAPYALVVIPLLVETGAYQAILDRVLVVDCGEDVQIKRALGRGGWSRAEILAMMAKQTDRETRLKHADDVIANAGDEANLAIQVATLHQTYLALGSSSET